MTDNKKVKILKSWHAIEFFQPHDLLEYDFEFKFTIDGLRHLKNEDLPWISADKRLALGIPLSKTCTYSLDLCLFDKNEITQAANLYLSEETKSFISSEEIEERINDEGSTCFANLKLDQYGTPDFANFSVSTVPWAIGMLKKNELNKLSYNEFQHSCDMLSEALNRVWQMLKAHPDKSCAPTLCLDSLSNIISCLYEWAEFCPNKTIKNPEKSFILKLVLHPKDINDKSRIEDNAANKNNKIQVNDTQQKESDNESQEQEDDDDHEDPILPILNSFYIEDIEWAINSIMGNMGNKPLNQYLSIKQDKKDDLYTQKGLRIINNHQAVNLMPLGRWPADPSHNMSLMQQFAINTTIKDLNKNGGILSVNGPPGTGKTTLLRDIIAHNITERAEILASFKNTKATLDESGYPQKCLSGFEMVVASSNNAAVENISKDLPRMKELGEEFKNIDYLQSVANQLAAKRKRSCPHKNNMYSPLDDKDHCWGIVSAKLGKKANRYEFVNKLFFDEHFPRGSKEESNRADEYNFLSLWRWLKVEDVIPFAQARKNFLEQRKELAAVIDNLNKVQTLLNQLSKKTNSKYLSEEMHGISQTIIKNKTVSKALECLELERGKLDKKLEIEQQICKAILAKKPNWIIQILRPKKYRKYYYRLTKSELKLEKIIKTSSLLDAIENNLSKLGELLDLYPGIALPDNNVKINDPELQRNAPWQNTEINRLRSKLFISALVLHKAWLKEALELSSFKSNIFNIKDALLGEDCADDERLWQCLFMIVPVVSTTFASMGRMFKKVKRDALGWLFIDEAGQATPQAAVGGMLRFKKVLAVGDPLQIEPVVTTPPQIINKICENNLGSAADDWNPFTHSLQQIADRSHAYGCKLDIMNKETWIGIPLWVHRRCVEPMFSMSNLMAYNNRMIHGKDAKDIVSKTLKNGSGNFWLSSKGTCVEKQFKNELVPHTEQLLIQIQDAGYDLKEDVYVITPFKAVKQRLREALRSYNLGNNLGTVHTFQGKQNNIVILVLGCCPDNDGGAFWAASKPNILNVAVTRAKNNLFIVGDPAVWADKPYFNNIPKEIEMISKISQCHNQSKHND